MTDMVANPQGIVNQIEAAFKSKTRDEWAEAFLRKH